jgi:hypothetical protein
MTRSRLTATEILHGARAYSQNASRRAHQLSGPKRVRVMHEPIGDASLNDGIDSPCEHCGYQICNCGPCATCGEVPYYCNGSHAYEPAPAVQPIPAPPAEERFKVGQRVKCLRGGPYIPLTVGREYIVIPPDAGFDADPTHAWIVCDDGETDGFPIVMFEPAPIAEAPAVESDPIADCERLGMWFTASTGGQGWNVRTDVFIAVRHFDNITDKAEAARAALLAYASRGKP